MAIATNDGHVSRALDLYNKENKYFIFGNTIPWSNEPSPDIPKESDHNLVNIIGLKKVDNCFLVVPDDKGTIVYKDQKWKTVLPPLFKQIITATTKGSTVLTVNNVEGILTGSKVRINNNFTTTVASLVSNEISVVDPVPEIYQEGSVVEIGAYAEAAKYVYLDTFLEYNSFPLVTYRQIGLCTQVSADTSITSSNNVLLSSAFSSSGKNEFSSLGRLEILDNRQPLPRDESMREQISMVIQM